jgi:hypothetical protein
LAWKAAADDIDGNSIGSKSAGGKGSDVVIAWHLGPVFRQHAPAEWIDLAKGDRLETGPLKPKAEPANP